MVSWEQDYHYFIPHHPSYALYFGNAFYASYYRAKYEYRPISPTAGEPWSDTYFKVSFGMTFGARYFFNSKYYLDLSFPLRDIVGLEYELVNDPYNGGLTKEIHGDFFSINDYSVRFGLGVRILTKGK